MSHLFKQWFEFRLKLDRRKFARGAEVSLLPWVMVATLVAGAVSAETLTPEQVALIKKYRAINESLHPQTGDIYLKSANVTLHLGKNYYYLPPDEAKNVLVNAWDNPPDAVKGELGMVFPTGNHFWDVKGWAAVIEYDASGYIRSEQHSQSDFDAAAKAIRDSEDQSNEARKKNNAVPIHFVGWAQPPSYDENDHTMIWARDLHFGALPVDTLNYDVRILSRRGYLSMNMVSTMPELAAIRPAAEQLRRTAYFDVGSRYADFNATTDKKSDLGIAGLVAAGAGAVLAQKLGLFAMAALFLKKGLVLIVAGCAAVVAWVRRAFGGSKKST